MSNTMLDDFNMSTAIEDNTPIPVDDGTLDQLDLAQGLYDQYRRALSLAQEAELATDAKFNERAQALNTLNSVLAQLTKMQTDLWNSERIKRIEQVLIQTLKEFPPDLQKAFTDRYEEALKTL